MSDNFQDELLEEVLDHDKRMVNAFRNICQQQMNYPKKNWRYEKEYRWKKWTIDLKIEKVVEVDVRVDITLKNTRRKKNRKWSWKIDYERTVSECKK